MKLLIEVPTSGALLHNIRIAMRRVTNLSDIKREHAHFSSFFFSHLNSGAVENAALSFIWAGLVYQGAVLLLIN